MKPKNSAKKNDIAEITITDINNLGCGVGRVDGVVTFVAGACTGDELVIRIIKVASDYNVGKIEKIKKASPYRTDSGCIAAKRCGGCVYRYITYEHELELKRNRVTAAMKKARLSLTVGEVMHTGELDGYRNKAQYPIGTVRLVKGNSATKRTAIGFYAEKSHEIIPCVCEDGSCRLQPQIFGEIADFVRVWMDENKLSAYDELTGKGVMRHLYLRRSESTGEVMVCFVVTAKNEKLTALTSAICERFPDVASIWENVNSKNTNVVLGREWRLMYGKEKLTDTLCGCTFEISPQSFWQVNRKGAEMLYNKAAELAEIKPGERVLDLFCGIGTVGISVTTPDVKLYGIEIVPEAVENAKRNAEINGYTNAEFVCADAADPDDFNKHLERIAADGLDVVILDPPRKGCSPELLRRLCELAPRRIVYISCNPDTLARDIALLAERYCCDEVTPVDMFPRTGHCECVVCLSREKADDCIKELKMISDEKCGYKSWSNLKKQMHDLLCNSLKDKISYFYTSYHEVHNAYGRATINYSKKELIAFSWVEMYAQEREVSQLYREGKKASYGELEKGKWMPECKLCDADFINSLTIYLKTDIAASLNSDNYLLRVFAFMDRRVGKRTLIKIKDDVEKLPDWVKQFYQIRCEADGIVFPPKRITDECVTKLQIKI